LHLSVWQEVLEYMKHLFRLCELIPIQNQYSVKLALSLFNVLIWLYHKGQDISLCNLQNFVLPLTGKQNQI